MPLMVADNYGPEQRLLNDRFCAATGIRRTDYVLDACMAPAGGPRVTPHVLQCLTRCLGRMSPNNWSSVAEWGFHRFRSPPHVAQTAVRSEGLLPRQHVDDSDGAHAHHRTRAHARHRQPAGGEGESLRAPTVLHRASLYVGRANYLDQVRLVTCSGGNAGSGPPGSAA